jgi:hypothetical protein
VNPDLSTTPNRRIALLIDADNVSHGKIRISSARYLEELVNAYIATGGTDGQAAEQPPPTPERGERGR